MIGVAVLKVLCCFFPANVIHKAKKLIIKLGSCKAMEKDKIPSDLAGLLYPNETIVLYMKQKKYHPSINLDSVALTERRVILRKPSMLGAKKSYTDYSYADILNVTLDKGLKRSTLKLNLRQHGDDLFVEDIPNDLAQEAFKIIRAGIDQERSKFNF